MEKNGEFLPNEHIQDTQLEGLELPVVASFDATTEGVENSRECTSTYEGDDYYYCEHVPNSSPGIMRPLNWDSYTWHRR